jgi:ribosomal protein L30/L7E
LIAYYKLGLNKKNNMIIEMPPLTIVQKYDVKLNPETKELISKVETLISEALKTSDQATIDAANEVYYYLNKKFAK